MFATSVARAVVVVAAVAVTVGGCATSAPRPAGPTDSAMSPTVTDRSEVAASAAASSSTSSVVCESPDASGRQLVLTQRYRQLSCPEMTAVAQRFISGAGRNAGSADGAVSTFDGWNCAAPTAAGAASQATQLTCTRIADNARFIGSRAGEPVPPREQPASDYETGGDQSGTTYFVSPTGLWHCGITTGSAGCSGKMPASAPTVPSPWGEHDPVRPNTISVATTGAAAFSAREDAAYFSPTARVLQYGDILTAHGFTCSVDADTGIHCTAGTHGFTVATQGFQLQ